MPESQKYKKADGISETEDRKRFGKEAQTKENKRIIKSVTAGDTIGRIKNE